MARRAHTYPQVEPGAAGLVDVAIPQVAADASSAAALSVARKSDAPAVRTSAGDVVLRDDLVRAVDLDLGELRAAVLARPLPACTGRG